MCRMISVDEEELARRRGPGVVVPHEHCVEDVKALVIDAKNQRREREPLSLSHLSQKRQMHLRGVQRSTVLPNVVGSDPEPLEDSGCRFGDAIA
jgi:hypothetical protein